MVDVTEKSLIVNQNEHLKCEDTQCQINHTKNSKYF